MIDLTDLPENIEEMIKEDLRKFDAHNPTAKEVESDGAPPQAGQDGPKEESQSEDTLAQQLSGLRTEIGKLNTTTALLRGDLFEINGRLDILLDQQSEPDKAVRKSQREDSKSWTWLQGFGTAVILSPVIFGLGMLAARGVSQLAGSWHMPMDWLVGTLLCVVAGLLLLYLAWDRHRLKKMLEWPFTDDWPEGDKADFVGAESAKKKHKEPKPR